MPALAGGGGGLARDAAPRGRGACPVGVDAGLLTACYPRGGDDARAVSDEERASGEGASVAPRPPRREPRHVSRAAQRAVGAAARERAVPMTGPRRAASLAVALLAGAVAAAPRPPAARLRAVTPELLAHSRFYLHSFEQLEAQEPELSACGLSLYALSVYARLEAHPSRTTNRSDADVEVFAPYSLVDEVMYPCAYGRRGRAHVAQWARAPRSPAADHTTVVCAQTASTGTTTGGAISATRRLTPWATARSCFRPA